MNLEDVIDPEYGLQQDEWSGRSQALPRVRELSGSVKGLYTQGY